MRMNASGYRLAVGLVIAAILGGGTTDALAADVNTGILPDAPTAPAWTASYYEQTVNQRYLNRQGCRTAQTQPNTTLNGVVFLVFGAPRRMPNGDWAQLRISVDTRWALGSILNGLKAWSRGYHNCYPTGSTKRITIVWGTSNGFIPSSWTDAMPSSSETVSHAHGKAFAQNVRGYHDWIKCGASCGKKVYNRQFAAGGIDIETAWSPWALTRQWVDGYNSVVNARTLIDFGANEERICEGVTFCRGGWTSARRFDIAWGGRTHPCPQIYNFTHSQYQWAALHAYGRDSGLGRMNFYCVLSTTEGYTPSDSWRKLWSDLRRATPVGTDPAQSYERYLRRRLTRISFPNP